MNQSKISYKGFEIYTIEHTQPHLIEGKWIHKGFGISDGICNAAPGCGWSQTIEGAKEMIDQLLISGMIHFSVCFSRDLLNPIIQEHLKNIPIPVDREYALNVYYSKWNSAAKEAVERKHRSMKKSDARCSSLRLYDGIGFITLEVGVSI